MARRLEDLDDLEKLALIPMSYSRLNTYSMCEAMYFYNYVVKEDQVFGAAAKLGNVLHSVLENTLEAGIVVEQDHLPQYQEEFKLQLAEQDPDSLIPDKLRNDGLDMIQQFLDRNEGTSFPIEAKEKAFQIVIGSAYIRGFIDRVDVEGDRITITDYKAQPLDSPILTPQGWTTMGEIKPGDQVIGQNGSPTTVAAVYPQGMVPAYRVSFTDGTSTVCSDSHLWHVTDIAGREFVKSTDSLGELRSGANYRWHIPSVEPVEFEKRKSPLPIHPYIMGVILGDGGTTGGTVKLHCEDPEILDRVRELLPTNLRLVHDYHKSTRITSVNRKNQYLVSLREMNLMKVGSPFKRIPEEYLFASIEDRIDLLRGLMDTDGGCSTRTEYRTTSVQLRDDIVHLIRSLGGIPRSSNHQPYYKKDGVRVHGKTCYVINTRIGINPFYLPRKAEHWHSPKYETNRHIKSVERISDLPMQCIRVAADDGLYVTEDFIVTHNSGRKEVSAKNAPQDLQLGLYALAMSLEYPDKEIYAQLYYLRSDRLKGHLFTRDDLVSVESRFLQLVQDVINKNTFHFTPNKNICGFCDFAETGACSVGAKRRRYQR